MRCPECNVLNEADSAACGACGLLLVNLETPRRRSEDLRARARRTSDRAKKSCEYCRASIELDAVRCCHCSEIVDAELATAPALRGRVQVKHASWVFLGSGLLALLLFRPVGLFAIGAGLILSIAYHAIPIESAAAHRHPSQLRKLLGRLKNSISLQRTSIQIPKLTRRRLIVLCSPLLAAGVGFVANFILLQHPMNQVLRENPELRGIRVSTHYAWWVVPGVVVYDLKGVTGSQSRLDVHTVLLEYAKRMKSRNVRTVELRYRGDARFSIDGASFRRLGEEYANQNFAFALFEFPRLIGAAPGDPSLDGSDALISFHDLWYADALLSPGGP